MSLRDDRSRSDPSAASPCGFAPQDVALQVTEPSEPFDIPRQFGRYRIVRKLGSGGMGSVYLAEDTQLERQVALKVPHFDPRTDADVLERFDREAKTAAKLSHANTCQILDVGAIDGQRYLTMEFIDGPPLTELVDSKTLTDKQAIQLVRKIAAAVAEAHGLNIIHRDLKPANIMLTAQGDPKVMDFGLARRVGMNDQRLTQSGMIIGTPAYMSLEQLTGKLDHVGPHSDVYSLGVILYELLTGHLPFDVPADAPVTALFAKILTAPPDPLTKYRSDIDPRLEAIALKAIAKQHSDRYRSMAELSAALTAHLKVANQPVDSNLTPAAQETGVTHERGPSTVAKQKQRRPTNEESNGVAPHADDEPLAYEADWQPQRFVTKRRKKRKRKSRDWRQLTKQISIAVLWIGLAVMTAFGLIELVKQTSSSTPMTGVGAGAGGGGGFAGGGGGLAGDQGGPGVITGIPPMPPRQSAPQISSVKSMQTPKSTVVSTAPAGVPRQSLPPLNQQPIEIQKMMKGVDEFDFRKDSTVDQSGSQQPSTTNKAQGDIYPGDAIAAVRLVAFLRECDLINIKSSPNAPLAANYLVDYIEARKTSPDLQDARRVVNALLALVTLRENDKRTLAVADEVIRVANPINVQAAKDARDALALSIAIGSSPNLNAVGTATPNTKVNRPVPAPKKINF